MYYYYRGTYVLVVLSRHHAIIPNPPFYEYS